MLNVGAATGNRIVNSAEVGAESVIPDLYAIAFNVDVLPIDTGPEYKIPTVELGTEPSNVYLIDAPEVGDEIEIFCAELYVPPIGLNTGA